jgi:catechol 2,3-dioxygenase-like lactoylglutathione lyase family enzyme
MLGLRRATSPSFWQSEMPIAIAAIDHLVLNVRDAEVAADWYQRVLGMRRGTSSEGRISLHFGRQKINVRPVATSKDDWFTADHESAGSEDICFITESLPNETLAHLQACGVAVEAGPVERIGAGGKMISVYCRDPDGSLIEVACYGAP